MSQPFQDLLDRVHKDLKAGRVYDAIWMIREYDYKRCRIRRKKAVLTEMRRCRRYEKLYGKTLAPNDIDVAYLRGAADALEWALHPTHGGPKPPTIKVRL